MPGSGLKRKRSQEGEGEEPAGAPPSTALFSLSVSKLHQSLQRVEPDLRHLVLVANALRRLRGEMEPPSASCGGAWPDGSTRGAGQRPPPPPSLTPVDQLLLSGMDTSFFSSILEDLASANAFSDPLCPSTAQSPDPGWTAQLDLLGPLELLGPTEGLADTFEDIDTSMYACDPWAPGKEACSSPEGGRPDLDYLLDVLVGVEEL